MASWNSYRTIVLVLVARFHINFITCTLGFIFRAKKIRSDITLQMPSSPNSHAHRM